MERDSWKYSLIPINAEKAFDKVQHLFVVKALSNQDQKGTSLIWWSLNTQTLRIHHSEWETGTFPLVSGAGRSPTLSFNGERNRNGGSEDKPVVPLLPATHPPSQSPLCLSRVPELLLIHSATGGLPLGSPQQEGTGVGGRVCSVLFPAVPAPVRVNSWALSRCLFYGWLIYSSRNSLIYELNRFTNTRTKFSKVASYKTTL